MLEAFADGKQRLTITVTDPEVNGVRAGLSADQQAFYFSGSSIPLYNQNTWMEQVNDYTVKLIGEYQIPQSSGGGASDAPSSDPSADPSASPPSGGDSAYRGPVYFYMVARDGVYNKVERPLEVGQAEPELEPTLTSSPSPPSPDDDDMCSADSPTLLPEELRVLVDNVQQTNAVNTNAINQFDKAEADVERLKDVLELLGCSDPENGCSDVSSRKVSAHLEKYQQAKARQDSSRNQIVTQAEQLNAQLQQIVQQSVNGFGFEYVVPTEERLSGFDDYKSALNELHIDFKAELEINNTFSVLYASADYVNMTLNQASATSSLMNIIQGLLLNLIPVGNNPIHHPFQSGFE